MVNGDQTSHNIHPLAKVNREWNKSQPPGSPAIQEKFDQPEFISVKCNIHPWMHGWFAVLKTNHYSITGDGGASLCPIFRRENTPSPPGMKTTEPRLQDVTITGNETKTRSTLASKPKPY